MRRAGLAAAALMLIAFPLAGAETPAKVKLVDTKKSGVYTSGKWRYDYTIRSAGTRSEGRHGELAFDGKPIAGMKKLDRIDTPWGMMQHFGPRPRTFGNGGWLLKTTYDHPIDPKKGKLLPSPESDEKVAETAAALKRGVNGFVFHLQYFGDENKPFYRLKLSVQRPRPSRETPDLYAGVTEKQTLVIIDHLAASGYLARAERLDPDVRGEWPGPRGPCYLLTVRAGRTILRDDLGWDLAMLKRLDALRRVLDGDAAKQMDLLLGRLSGLRKAWEKADSPPRK